MSGPILPLVSYGPSGGGGPALSLTVTGDSLDGAFLSQYMSTQQQTDWQNGVYGTLNIAAAGDPPRGYWVLSGSSSTEAGTGGVSGFALDLDPGVPVTINLDTSQLRIYGSGGSGADNAPGGGASAVAGGHAIAFEIGSSTVMNLNIINANGGNTGRIFAAGGGGGYNIGVTNGSGGGGAAGWFPGWGDTDHGAQFGGIYDTANGGTGDPDVAGGNGVPVLGQMGGGLAQAGTNGTASLGRAGGLAVFRFGQPGATVIVSGGGTSFIRGVTQ